MFLQNLKHVMEAIPAALHRSNALMAKATATTTTTAKATLSAASTTVIGPILLLIPQMIAVSISF